MQGSSKFFLSLDNEYRHLFPQGMCDSPSLVLSRTIEIKYPFEFLEPLLLHITASHISKRHGNTSHEEKTNWMYWIYSNIGFPLLFIRTIELSCAFLSSFQRRFEVQRLN